MSLETEERHNLPAAPLHNSHGHIAGKCVIFIVFQNTLNNWFVLLHIWCVKLYCCIYIACFKITQFPPKCEYRHFGIGPLPNVGKNPLTLDSTNKHNNKLHQDTQLVNLSAFICFLERLFGGNCELLLRDQFLPLECAVTSYSCQFTEQLDVIYQIHKCLFVPWVKRSWRSLLAPKLAVSS